MHMHHKPKLRFVIEPIDEHIQSSVSALLLLCRYTLLGVARWRCGGGHVRAYTWTPRSYQGTHLAEERKKKVPRMLHALYIRVASREEKIGFEPTC